MARITVEDCLEKIPNLFDLVLTASKRSRRLANGAEPMVEWENDKPTVVALREIAAGHIDIDILEENEQQQALDAVFEEEPQAAAPTPAPTLSSLPLAQVARPEASPSTTQPTAPKPVAKAKPEPAAEPTEPPPPKLDQEQPPAPVPNQEEPPAPVLTSSDTDAELAAAMAQADSTSPSDTDAELAAHLSTDADPAPSQKAEPESEAPVDLDAELAAQMSKMEAKPDADQSGDDKKDDGESVPPTLKPTE